jgi:hypothetical protein
MDSGKAGCGHRSEGRGGSFGREPSRALVCDESLDRGAAAFPVAVPALGARRAGQMLSRFVAGPEGSPRGG